jgi:hypothetical protein
MKTSRFRAASTILALTLAGWAATVTGCGNGQNGCDEARAQTIDKIVACIGGWAGDDDGPQECSDFASDLTLCQAKLFVNAPCECIGYGEVLGDTSKCPPITEELLLDAFQRCPF